MVSQALERHEPGAVLERRIDDVVHIWEDLGERGPTFGSPDSGDAPQCRERYLLPLARVLIGALAGSAVHRAVYLDERCRYLPPGLRLSERSAAFRERLPDEIDALARLAANSADEAQVASQLTALHGPLMDDAESSCRVLFIGDCLFVETRAFLVDRQRQDGGVEAHQVFFSTRQQLGSVDSAIVNEVGRLRPDVIGLSLFTFEGVPPYTAAWRSAGTLRGALGAFRQADELVELVRQAVEDIRSVSDATLVIHAPCGIPVGPWRRRIKWLPEHSSGQRRLLKALRDSLARLVDNTVNTILLDESQLVCAAGGARTVGGALFAPDDVPPGYFHTTRLGPLAAEEYSGILADYALLGRAKALFVDFDNTLWRGVMGDGAVVHDVALQQTLRRLKEAGVLLVALSKNDPSTIRWDEMLLQPEDFVMLQVNWRPKPDNVSEAVAALDLSPSAFVLLDDNPVERALVTEQVPGLKAIDPTSSAGRRALARWLEFPSTTQTPEASRRTRMYREAAERRASVVGAHDYASMMESLQLRFSVRPAQRHDHDRLLELIQRTNQFNTTTIRRSAAEVDALVADEGTGVYVADLRDRFGDLGVVAVAIFDRSCATFDAVVMSCRAMGFGVEVGLVARVLEAEGPGEVRGRLNQTDRNGPSRDLFERLAFESQADGEWVLAENAPRPTVPTWLKEHGR